MSDIQQIKDLMPQEVGYGTYPEETVENCIKIIKMIRKEQDSKVQVDIFNELIDKLFMNSSGFFVGVQMEPHTKMLKEQEEKILEMLKKLQRLSYYISYKKACKNDKNRLDTFNLRLKALKEEYGGTVQNKEQIAQQKQQRFETAKRRVARLPRKREKEPTKTGKER